MTLREFAAYLGVSDRAVSKWEAGAESYVPRSESQALLDTALARSPEDAQTRFAAAVQDDPDTFDRAENSDFHLSSHKFIPVFIGADHAAELLSDPSTRTVDSWHEAGALRVDHSDARACTLHVAGCGTALFHLVQDRHPESLTELAVWRYRTYASDLPWAARVMTELLGGYWQGAEPEYVLSLYWLHSSPWTKDDLHTALRLLSTPSVLVDRGAPGGPVALEESVETSLMASGFDHPDIVSFGVRGVSVGYAGWSGVAYAAEAPERSLTVDELVACELSVQTLWCYTRHIQRLIETGHDPAMPERYGWRFLRAAYSRLTTARPQETAQHCLMREAIVQTSGLAQRLREAQDALRESAG